MPVALAKPAATPIPVQRSASEFTRFILPHLTMPGRICQLGEPLTATASVPQTTRCPTPAGETTNA